MDLLYDVFVIIWFNMINGIPAKVSEPSFDTIKGVKCNDGVILHNWNIWLFFQ